MAEIKIEQKKLIWPWLFVIIVVLALLVYFIAFHDIKKDIKTDYISNTIKPELLEVKENNSTVAAYISFIENSKIKMDIDHIYSNEALLKLVEATNAIANISGYEIQADLDKVKLYAMLITKDPFDRSHADNIRKADDILTFALENIQKAKYPSLVDEIEALKRASEAIKPGILTLDQKDAIKNYFEKASELLQKMN
jgi:PIN domain nuclease of toxin-antitoxin system